MKFKIPFYCFLFTYFSFEYACNILCYIIFSPIFILLLNTVSYYIYSILILYLIHFSPIHFSHHCVSLIYFYYVILIYLTNPRKTKNPLYKKRASIHQLTLYFLLIFIAKISKNLFIVIFSTLSEYQESLAPISLPSYLTSKGI